jgi:hypothetical protein
MSALSFQASTNTTNYLGGSSPAPYTYFFAGTTLSLKAVGSASGSIPFSPAPTFTVNPNAAARLVIVPPSMQLSSGTNAGNGRTGTLDSEQPNQTFPVIVYQTDNWFNVVSGAPSVTVSGLDMTSSQTHALSGGQSSFNVTISVARKTSKITATAASLTSDQVDISMGGPEPEQVYPHPSPFNPAVGETVKFRVSLNEDETVRIIVKDRFGQDVWTTESRASKGLSEIPWDGHNEKGNIVAAGVYNVLLEIGGDVKSKKRFGVVK